MKKIYLILSFIVCALSFNYSQNTKYFIILKNNCKSYQNAYINSHSLKNLQKGDKLYIVGREADFLKTTDGQYIHRSDVEIYENKITRTNAQIDIIAGEYKQKLKEKNKEGLNLNNNSRDFIELPIRDTVNFNNLKF